MHILTSSLCVAIALTPTATFAQSESTFISIPSSAFTGRFYHDGRGHDGNETGTARIFGRSQILFAPALLPHRSTVTSLRCGGSSDGGFALTFTLRRNDPQQANVDMAQAETPRVRGFHFVDAPEIVEPVVNNGRFNYYIAVTTSDPTADEQSCESCSVGYCRIGVAQ